VKQLYNCLGSFWIWLILFQPKQQDGAVFYNNHSKNNQLNCEKITNKDLDEDKIHIDLTTKDALTKNKISKQEFEAMTTMIRDRVRSTICTKYIKTQPPDLPA
jgi:hypothetical protein